MDMRYQQRVVAATQPYSVPTPSGASALADPLGQMLGLQLAILAEMGEADTARRTGIRRLDLKALMCIAQLQPLPTGRLVQILGISQGGVTSILNRLEKDGYIRRGRSLEDRRLVTLYLSNDKVLDLIFPEGTTAALRPILADKDPHEIGRLLGLLAECLDSLTHRAKVPPPA